MCLIMKIVPDNKFSRNIDISKDQRKCRLKFVSDVILNKNDETTSYDIIECYDIL